MRINCNLNSTYIMLNELSCHRKTRKTKRGNIGHIMNIANYIVEYSKTNPEISGYVNKNEKWQEFTDTVLKKSNEIRDTKIAGVDVKEMFPYKREYVNTKAYLILNIVGSKADY